MIYTINGQLFATKKATVQYVRELVERTPINTPLTGDDFDFVSAYLQHHHEYEQKAGVGIAAITLIRPSTNPNTKCFYITRVDGSGTDISWARCLDKRNKRREVMEAMRIEIAYQITKFKAQFPATGTHCPYTGEELTADSTEVDHEYPLTFKRLAQDFLTSIDMTVEDVEITQPADNQTVTFLTDVDFKHAWRMYHKEHAKLRLLSKTGHLKHAKKGD